MMGRQSRQMAMIFVDIESLIPETHLLRKIERMISFDFIYDLLAPYYPATGSPSVNPVVQNALDRIPVWHQIRAAVDGGSSAQHRLPMVLRI